MDYEKTVELPGDASAGVSFLINNFTQLGFRIEHKDHSSCVLIGPGMNNSRQSPLLGISRLQVDSSRNTLNVKAELKAAQKMRQFLIWFIGGMFVFMMIVFGVVFRGREDFRWWIPALPFLPWPFLIPMIGRMIEKRTRVALDNTLHNIQMSMRA